jgi:hypothetical protein
MFLMHLCVVSDYFKKYFDYFIERLAGGMACVEGPRGFKHYDTLHRAVCLGKVMDIVAAVLEEQEPPRRNIKDLLKGAFRRIAAVR